MNDKFSISEIANYLGVTRGAVYQNIKKGKLKAVMPESRWQIDIADVHEFRKSKYSRKGRKKDGELVINEAAGERDSNAACEFLNVEPMQLYHLCRSGQLKFHRKGWTYVFRVEDLEAFLRNRRK